MKKFFTEIEIEVFDCKGDVLLQSAQAQTRGVYDMGGSKEWDLFSK